jgi:hypothetical protein
VGGDLRDEFDIGGFDADFAGGIFDTSAVEGVQLQFEQAFFAHILEGFIYNL